MNSRGIKVVLGIRTSFKDCMCLSYIINFQGIRVIRISCKHLINHMPCFLMVNLGNIGIGFVIILIPVLNVSGTIQKTESMLFEHFVRSRVLGLQLTSIVDFASWRFVMGDECLNILFF